MTKPTQFLNEAFQAHRRGLYRYLRERLENEEDAKELAQETFLRLLRVARSDLVTDPQGYLYRVARNLIYERNCKALPAERWAEYTEIEMLEDPGETLELEVDRARLSESIERIVAELPPRNRAIVLLFCQEGLSHREISERLGLSKSMVQKCLAQGMAHCRKRMRISSDVVHRKGVPQ